MAFTDNIYEQIQAYLRNELPQEERTAFEAQIQKDPALGAEVEDYRNALKAIDAYAWAETRKQVNTIFNESMSEESREARRFSPAILRMAAVIVILLASVFTFIYLRGSFSNSGLYNTAFETYPNRFSTMGTPMTDENRFREGLEAYSLNDHIKAEELLSAISPADSNYNHARFYLGQVRLAAGKAQASAEDFKWILTNDSRYNEPAQWYLALAQLESGNEAKAKELFTAISTTRNHYKKDEAAAILKKMNSFWRKIPGI